MALSWPKKIWPFVAPVFFRNEANQDCLISVIASIIRDARILNDAKEDAFALAARDPLLEKPEHLLLRRNAALEMARQIGFGQNGVNRKLHPVLFIIAIQLIFGGQSSFSMVYGFFT